MYELEKPNKVIIKIFSSDHENSFILANDKNTAKIPENQASNVQKRSI